MPVYEYQCKQCGREFEYQQRMADPDKTLCEACGAEALERIISRTAFQLKGGGWYKDLYASSKPEKSASDAGSGTTSAPAESKPAAASSDSSGSGSSTPSTPAASTSGSSSSGGGTSSGGGGGTSTTTGST